MILSFPPNLWAGTSSWSSRDWRGTFYPDGIAPARMITAYAEKLRTVEIDATWHAMPSRRVVEAWRERTPPGFVFAAKVPKTISHDKYLVDCESDVAEYLSAMELLGDRLGPMILQFPYVARGRDAAEHDTGADFVARLRRFLPLLPACFRWGIEVRNPRWLRPELLDLLRSRNVALVFIDYVTMDPLPKLAHRPEVFTADFVYVRFLGNHREMDAAVRRACELGARRGEWESLLVDRTAEMKSWIPPLRDLVARDIPTYVYFNNHYAGYAPGSLELFHRLFWADARAATA